MYPLVALVLAAGGLHGASHPSSTPAGPTRTGAPSHGRGSPAPLPAVAKLPPDAEVRLVEKPEPAALLLGMVQVRCGILEDCTASLQQQARAQGGNRLYGVSQHSDQWWAALARAAP